MPDKDGFPTQEELRQLPMRAIVAYAVRCARRIQPLYQLPDDHPQLQEHVAAVEQALSLSEQFAAGETTDSAELELGSTAADVYAAAAAGASAAGAAAAAYSVAGTASAGYSAANAAYAASAASSSDAASAAYSSYSAYSAAAAATDAAGAGAARDYERLLTLNLGKTGELGEPIDATENGPLGPWRTNIIRTGIAIDATENGPLGPYWPDGPPDWYSEGLEWMRGILEHEADDPPADSGGDDPVVNPDQLRIQFELPDYVDGDEAGEAIARFVKALNAYHIACGGQGLEIDDWEIRVRSDVPVEVL